MRTSTPHDLDAHRITSPLSQSLYSPAFNEQSIVAGAVVLKSARTEALQQYFDRLVRNIWNRRICFEQEKKVKKFFFEIFTMSI